MQHDDLIWQIINNGFCSFKIKTETQPFCRHPQNVSGLCSRTNCPLSNSQYATVMEHNGVCFLYLKTIERAHSPRHLWEKIKLKENLAQAFEQIDTHLQYWDKKLIYKCKQRLIKMRQYLIRKRKIQLKAHLAPKLLTINKKIERREKVREKKAEIAAQLETSIKKELLERLKNNVYGDIYNFPQKEFESVMEGKEIEEEEEEEIEYLNDEEVPAFVEYDDDEDMWNNFDDQGDDDEGGEEEEEFENENSASDDDEERSDEEDEEKEDRKEIITKNEKAEQITTKDNRRSNRIAKKLNELKTKRPASSTSNPQTDKKRKVAARGHIELQYEVEVETPLRKQLN